MIRLRRLFFLGSVLASLLVAWPSSARAQCTGGSATQPQFAVVPASQIGQSGGLAVTSYVAAAGPLGLSSKHLSVTTFTNTTFSWDTWNAVSMNTTVSVNGGAPQPYPQISGLSGDYTTESSSPVSLTFTMTATDQYGHTTQNQLFLTVVAATAQQPSGTIISQDGIPTNAYLVISNTFTHPSMMSSCAPCVNEPWKCTGTITHTPRFQATVTNHTQGTSTVIPWTQAGNPASSNETVNGSGWVSIALNANDVIDGSFNEDVQCSMESGIWGINVLFSFLPYQTFDKVDSHSGITWNVEPWCYNCCYPSGGTHCPAFPGDNRPAPLVPEAKVLWAGNYNPANPPTFFYSLGGCASTNIYPPGPYNGWNCSPGFAIPFFGTGWIKAYCTPTQPAPY